MGREIRRVPPNYQHPKKLVWGPPHFREEERFVPLLNTGYEEAAEEWKKEFLEFYSTGKNIEKECDYWEWAGNPPNKERYVSYKKEDATWYCVYETVSEGTPVTPPFATQEELADYLADHGDFWDQRRREEGDKNPHYAAWGKDASYRFVFGHGFIPSFVVQGGKVLTKAEMINEKRKT